MNIEGAASAAQLESPPPLPAPRVRRVRFTLINRRWLCAPISMPGTPPTYASRVRNRCVENHRCVVIGPASAHMREGRRV